MNNNTFPIISIAPMMDYTDRHDRYFLRLIAPHIHLYTEMITTHALKHGNVAHLLNYHPAERFLALQLGGSDPFELANCAKLGEQYGYDEINLNVGCPSSRVSAGRFGACLMLEPLLVAKCIAAMQAAIKIPVTLKCRIGIDHNDSYEALYYFISTIQAAGCKTFIIHARKAWLKGLSPKENREIPHLCYETVYNLKKDFPELTIIINGGIKTVAAISSHLSKVDGVMIGREAYSNPFLLSDIEQTIFNNERILSREEIIQKLLPYIQEELMKKTRLSAISRHILGLYHGMKGAGAWKRYLSEHSHLPNVGVEIIEQALLKVKEL